VNQEHLDAEVVAGWAEGSLDPEVRAAAEAHAADCMRCQAVLAAMVRTEPLADVRPSPAWFNAPVRWIVPFAAAAAALTLWVVVSQDARAPAVQQAASRTAETDALAERAAAPIEPAAPQAAPAQPAQARTREAQAADRELPPRAPAAFAVDPARKQAEPKSVPTAAADTAVTQTRVDELRREALTGGRSTPPVSRPAPAPPPPAQSIQQAQSAQQAQSIQQALPQVQITPENAEVVGRRGVAAQSPAIITSREFSSPDSGSRWRLGTSGAIQRSADAGKTWVAQASGVATDLIAASAPSNIVCWIVGRSGVVLLSTDAATWRRLPFPEATDLREVTATDARTASVTTVDGRVFHTSDGGFTWAR
jgi:hypothetical protein